MGRKEEYYLGYQKRLETAKQVVDITKGTLYQLSTTFTGNANTNIKSTTVPPIASAIYIPHDVTTLQSSSPNLWGSLSQ
jgi:hypothetical protein